jgi:hypothetical protein
MEMLVPLILVGIRMFGLTDQGEQDQRRLR